MVLVEGSVPVSFLLRSGLQDTPIATPHPNFGGDRLLVTRFGRDEDEEGRCKEGQ